MLDGWKDVKGVVHHQGYFGTKKTQELVARKYYWKDTRPAVTIDTYILLKVLVNRFCDGLSYLRIGTI